MPDSAVNKILYVQSMKLWTGEELNNAESVSDFEFLEDGNDFLIFADSENVKKSNLFALSLIEKFTRKDDQKYHFVGADLE